MTACALPIIFCTLIPINHDDSDGIILSNFMLDLEVLNNSIIKPPCFHLPFICYPSFMTFVKLKRSWFNCDTNFTSHVSLAIYPSLCLQITSNFPLCVQMMLCLLPIITDPCMGVRLQTPVLLLAI